MTTRTRNMDNTELLSAIMERSDVGPMMQIFIIASITHYAAKVKDVPDNALQEQLGQMIDASAWKAAAKEVLDSINARYTDERFQVQVRDEDDEVLFVRLDSENLTELRAAAMGAIGALEDVEKWVGNPGRKFGTTIQALHRGLMLTSGAHVDEEG